MAKIYREKNVWQTVDDAYMWAMIVKIRIVLGLRMFIVLYDVCELCIDTLTLSFCSQKYLVEQPNSLYKQERFFNRGQGQNMNPNNALHVCHPWSLIFTASDG